MHRNNGDGLRPYYGTIELGGRPVAIHSPRTAIDIGLGFVTEDRKTGGRLVLGMAVIVVSSAVPEALAISDRVIVVREGAIAAELSRHQATQQAVMEAAVA